MQRRVETKDIFPGYFDPAPGGVILASEESKELSAKRELEEEMGINDIELEFVGDMYYEDERAKV